MGGKTRNSFDFVLFNTSHPDILGKKMDKEYWIDDERELKDLIVMNCFGQRLDMTWLCNARNVSVYVNASWCTDNSSWYQINFNFYNTAQKHLKRFESEMGTLGYSSLFKRESYY